MNTSPFCNLCRKIFAKQLIAKKSRFGRNKVMINRRRKRCVWHISHHYCDDAECLNSIDGLKKECSDINTQGAELFIIDDPSPLSSSTSLSTYPIRKRRRLTALDLNVPIVPQDNNNNNNSKSITTTTTTTTTILTKCKPNSNANTSTPEYINGMN